VARARAQVALIRTMSELGSSCSPLALLAVRLLYLRMVVDVLSRLRMLVDVFTRRMLGGMRR
jgi:hypothetical protein